MRKVLLFVIMLLYAALADLVGSWLLGSGGSASVLYLNNPGDVVLLVVDALILMWLSRARWANDGVEWTRLFTFVFGIAFLLMGEYAAKVFVTGGLSTTIALEWYYFRLYLLMIIPVALWGQVAGLAWREQPRHRVEESFIS